MKRFLFLLVVCLVLSACNSKTEPITDTARETAELPTGTDVEIVVTNNSTTLFLDYTSQEDIIDLYISDCESIIQYALEDVATDIIISCRLNDNIIAEMNVAYHGYVDYAINLVILDDTYNATITQQYMYSNILYRYDILSEPTPSAPVVETTPLPTFSPDKETITPTNSGYSNVQKDMQDFLDSLATLYDGFILGGTAYTEKVFDIVVSNDWYMLQDNEKQYLAEELWKVIKVQYQQCSGADMCSLTICDTNLTTLAKSTWTKGMELKK